MLKNNRSIKIVFMLVKIIVTFFVIAIFAIIFLQRVSKNNINLGGYSIYTVVTESMVPKYNVYDMILVRETDVNKLVINDDLVYLGNTGDFSNKIITHRIIDIEERNGIKYFTTKGINNDIEDPEVTESQVMGKVVYKFSLLSLLSKIINNLYGFYFIVFVPLISLIVLEVVDFINEKKSKEEPNKDEEE